MPILDIVLAGLAVPVVATIAAALLVRLIGGRSVGARAAAVGVPIGLAAAYAVAPGWPWAPPTDPFDQLAWLAVGGGLLGLAIDLATPGRLTATIVAAVWPAIGLAWLGGAVLLHGDGNDLYRFGEVSVVLGLILVRLYRLSGDGVSGPLTAAVIAAGIGVLGLFSDVPGLAAVGLPLAATGIGWLACNWPKRRFPFGAAGLLGGSGVALVLAGHAALLTPVNASLVLVVLTAVLIQPVVPLLVGRLPGLRALSMRPVVTALFVAIPVAAAVALAWLAPTLIPSLY
jgi:hypothetical protein